MSRAAHDSGAADAALVEGLVIAHRRRRYTVRLEDGELVECVLRGRRTIVACGDRVRVAGVAGGGAIAEVVPRSTLFYRSDAFNEKLIAANVTQVVGVVAPGIGVDLELVDRWIVAAEAEGCRFVLVANKADEPGFTGLLARLERIAKLGYSVVAMAAKHDAAPLAPLLAGERTALIGQSGMGKSTILNAVVPGANARTAEVSEALAAGRHTTSESTLYPLDRAIDAGWIVDSPGLKAFGLAHVAAEALAGAFVEIRPLIGRCRFRDCRHDREPGCAVQEAVARGQIAAHRVALLHRLVKEGEARRAAAR
ncbi:MAG TPA: ribosome small subunit-dependent GTPase A [Casimicrobiaceae bacterium]|nr:ribosome small subunit-dependent GTPase A [Casimicrobiaceae bacterium]